MISSEALDEVSHLRVSAENPVTSTDEHLDFERCAALHNAILKHGWIAGGRDWADAPSHPQWTDETAPEGATENLHPDLIEFLKHCLALEEHGIFFHFTVGLNPCSDLWERLDMDGDCIALYNQNDSSSLSATTIIYDQDDHTCKFDGACHDVPDPETPTQWHRLETILSAWLDLIERGKIVALHYSVGGRSPPSAALIDEATGAKQEWSDQYPWTCVSFAKQDLADTLEAWHNLVSAINSRLPEPKAEPFAECGLYSQDTLRAAGIEEGSFAWGFFSNAWRPADGISRLGPGLRLATDDQLVNNPWKSWRSAVSGTDFPFPLLIGSTSISSWERGIRGSIHQIPWGLYLEQTGFNQDFVVEDGCRLALPYSVGANGHALKADGTPLDPKNGAFELYQLGRHPYVPCHDTQLYMVLDAFARSVADGLWKVGADGVDELDTVFKDADTEEGWACYRLVYSNCD